LDAYPQEAIIAIPGAALRNIRRFTHQF
jgi:hypothetical protein